MFCQQRDGGSPLAVRSNANEAHQQQVDSRKRLSSSVVPPANFLEASIKQGVRAKPAAATPRIKSAEGNVNRHKRH